MTTALVYPERILADARDRPVWLQARTGKIGGSDAAGFAKVDSWSLYLKSKLDESFTGNSYTVHGNDRERHMLAAYNLEQNHYLYRSAENPRHVATPDAIHVPADGRLVLAQAKTTKRKFKTVGGVEVIVPPFTNARGERAIPPAYQRQMWWEQYVMGAERTLFVFEEHENFQPVDMEPDSCWFYRDDDQIAQLITIADLVLEGIDTAQQFRRELES